jgi:hypothetical protein
VPPNRPHCHRRPSLAICAARCSASSPTPFRNADLSLWSQGRPRKYAPATLVSPRLCSGIRPDDGIPFAKIGRSIQSKSYRNPFAQMMDEMPAAARSRLKTGSVTCFGLHGASARSESGNSRPLRATCSSARSLKSMMDASPRTRFSPEVSRDRQPAILATEDAAKQHHPIGRQSTQIRVVPATDTGEQGR